MEPPEERTTKARFFPSTRVGLSVIGFLGCVFIYALRVNLSMTIVCMVNQTATAASPETNQSQASECYREEESQNKTKTEGKFIWSKDVQGWLLGAFFWGYLLTQILGGWMAQRFGAKRVLAANVLASIVFTMFTPLASELHFGVLMGLRILLGFAQGVTFPAFHTLWSHWSPPFERSKLTGINYAGAQIGNVITLPISGLLCDYGFAGGWPSVFYVLGLAAIIWLAIWMFYASDTPASHRTISQEEKHYIMDSLSHQVSEDQSKKKVPIPWCPMLKSMAVWAAIVGHFAGDWGAYTMLTCLPSFMKEVLQYDMTSLGFLASIPYVAYFICINLAGFVADFIRSRGILSTKNTRKAAMIIALGSQAAFLVGAGYCKCGQETLVIVLITLGTGLSGFQYAGFVINYMDIAPAFAGTVLGIGNTISCLCGIASPPIMGLMTPNKTRGEWLRVFYLTAAILVAGAVFFAIFAKGEVQDWARVDDEKKEEEEEEMLELNANEAKPEKKALPVIDENGEQVDQASAPLV